MQSISTSLQKNLNELKKRLPATDVLTYSFSSFDGGVYAIIYADGVVNKEFLGDLVARPGSIPKITIFCPLKS